MTETKTIFITGGASGIGLAIARATLSQGWHTVVADAHPGNLDQAREELRAHGELVRFETLDVTDETAVTAAMARCEAQGGRLAGVVNSAGIAADVPCLDTSTALFRKLIEVNLIGTFVVSREAARLMARRGGGSIVNLSSVSGVTGNIGRVAYGSTKAGVIMTTKVMAVELASARVRVNAIAPGPIDTPLARALHTPSIRASWSQTVPQRRYGTPDEVAQAALFLLDEARSSYVTGQVLCVDGGFTTAGLLPAPDASV